MDLSRRSVSQLLTYAFGVQTSILCTAFFQERLFTLSYYDGDSTQKLDSFEDKHFVVFGMRVFVLTLLAIYLLCRFLIGNRWTFNMAGQDLRLKIGLTIGLFSCIGCIFGFSLENSVRSANNGSEIGLAIWLIFSLIFTGFVALNLSRGDDQKATKSKFQMMLGMNVLNLITSFQAVHQQQQIQQSFDFLKTHPIFLQDFLILCMSEVVGQLFIYFTIEQFGFIVFGLSLIGHKLVTAAISSFYVISALHSTSILGIVSFLFSAFTGVGRIKEAKIE